MKKLNLTMEDVLKKVASGKITVEDAKKELGILTIERIENASLDIHRKYRKGIPEVVFGEGKEIDDIVKIVKILVERNDYALVTRMNNYIKLKGRLKGFDTNYNRKAKTLLVKKKNCVFPKNGRIGIITAGTTDIPAAEEAKVAAEIMGCEVLKAYDVGISALHRVFEPVKKMMEEDVSAIVVAAGMEGALPSVVSSLVDVPVIGVPTSVGYGIGEKGVGALTTMLQTCSPGLTVVNIDNGFGAGVFAGLIARRNKHG